MDNFVYSPKDAGLRPPPYDEMSHDHSEWKLEEAAVALRYWQQGAAILDKLFYTRRLRWRQVTEELEVGAFTRRLPFEPSWTPTFFSDKKGSIETVALSGPAREWENGSTTGSLCVLCKYHTATVINGSRRDGVVGFCAVSQQAKASKCRQKFDDRGTSTTRHGNSVCWSVTRHLTGEQQAALSTALMRAAFYTLVKLHTVQHKVREIERLIADKVPTADARVKAEVATAAV